MTRATALLALHAAIAGLALADAPKASMTLNVHDVIVGELQFGGWSGFSLEVRNEGDVPLRLASNNTKVPSLYRSRFWRLDIVGPVDGTCDRYAGGEVASAPGIGRELPTIDVAPGEVRFIPFGHPEIASPGTYRLSVTYDGRGVLPGDRPPNGVFRGVLKSTEVSFEITHPSSGPDADILRQWRQLNPNKPWCAFPLTGEIDPSGETVKVGPPFLQNPTLLRDFPESRFTAYVVFGRIGGYERGPKDHVLNAMKTGSYWSNNSLPMADADPEKDNGYVALSKDEAVRWYEEWCGLVLEVHPEIWFADYLRIKLALDKLSLGQTELAVDALESIVKDGQANASEVAREYLALMVERGMIERESLDSGLLAERPPTLEK